MTDLSKKRHPKKGPYCLKTYSTPRPLELMAQGKARVVNPEPHSSALILDTEVLTPCHASNVSPTDDRVVLMFRRAPARLRGQGHAAEDGPRRWARIRWASTVRVASSPTMAK